MMITKLALIKKIKRYENTINLKNVEKAIEFVRDKSKFYSLGSDFYQHSLEVANIIVDLKPNQASLIIASLLHDMIDFSKLIINVLCKEFGTDVSLLIQGITKFNRIIAQEIRVFDTENYKKLFIILNKDLRVLIIGLAECLQNIKECRQKSMSEQIKIASDVMNIYAPLAGRIGMQEIKAELQNIAFEILYPTENKAILQDIILLGYDYNKSINNTVNELNDLFQRYKVNCKVFGRCKSPCSIWMKMRQKNVKLDNLSDIIAFRIIVVDVIDCYVVLDILRSNYKYVKDSLQDFIKDPKQNGYQSIHILFNTSSHCMEIQIRTEEMHKIAERGVAAHWKYKVNTYYNYLPKIERMANIEDLIDDSIMIKHRYKIELKIILYRIDNLKHIISELLNHNCDIIDYKSKNYHLVKKFMETIFVVEVFDLEHLNEIINKLLIQNLVYLIQYSNA